MVVKQQQHRENIEYALFKRDYELMAEHHPELLDYIELAIDDGITPEVVKRWAVGVVEENQVIQRCFNAARYVVRINSD